MSLSSPTGPTGTAPLNLHDATPAVGDGRNEAQPAVREVRLSHIAVRRIKFLAHALYWAARHRSFARGAWVANYEGFTWN